MINGQSLESINRALKMAQDLEGRPAFGSSDIEMLLRDVISTSSKTSEIRLPLSVRWAPAATPLQLRRSPWI